MNQSQKILFQELQDELRRDPFSEERLEKIYRAIALEERVRDDEERIFGKHDRGGVELAMKADEIFTTKSKKLSTYYTGYDPYLERVSFMGKAHEVLDEGRGSLYIRPVGGGKSFWTSDSVRQHSFGNWLKQAKEKLESVCDFNWSEMAGYTEEWYGKMAKDPSRPDIGKFCTYQGKKFFIVEKGKTLWKIRFLNPEEDTGDKWVHWMDLQP